MKGDLNRGDPLDRNGTGDSVAMSGLAGVKPSLRTGQQFPRQDCTGWRPNAPKEDMSPDRLGRDANGYESLESTRLTWTGR
jgi:hypothetical protein